jgi:hypothetical protein
MRIAATILVILILGTTAFGQAASPAAPAPGPASSDAATTPAAPSPASTPTPAKRPNPFSPTVRPPTPGAEPVDAESTTYIAPTAAADKKPATPVLVGIVVTGESVLAIFRVGDTLGIGQPGDMLGDTGFQFAAYKDERAVLKNTAGETFRLRLTIQAPAAPPQTAASPTAE